MHHLLYGSYASGIVSPKLIQDILDSSQAKNSALGITGLLLYRSGRFLQLLEGDFDKVHRTLERIRADRRHSRVDVISEFESPQRLFPKWAMGSIQDERTRYGLSTHLDSIFQATLDPAGNRHGQVLQLLKEFSKSLQV